MKVSYYPGCSLHGSAREYDESTRAVARALGVELLDLPDWNCCGASSAHATDGTLATALAARNLAIAGEQGMDLVIPCAACYSRLKAAQSAEGGRNSEAGPMQVISLLDFFSSPDLLEPMRALVLRPLSGLKTVSYYGCLLVRPPGITGEALYEFPEAMDRIMSTLGADPIPWSYRTDCCGGSLVLPRKDIALDLTGKLMEKASMAGAKAIVVACTLCQSNLDSRQDELFKKSGKRYDVPVLYFTELIGLSLGLKDAAKWLKRHFVDPTNLVTSLGIA